MIRQGPSLRIEEIAITNFRTFRERTVIPFRGGAPDADALATFHGPNGSGKSNAIAALDLFFAAAINFIDLARPANLQWDTPVASHPGRHPLLVRYRDRPAEAEGATEIEVHFTDSRRCALRAVFTPSGDQVNVEIHTREQDRWLRPGERTSASHPGLVTSLRAPFGPTSRAFVIVDARRRASWLSSAPEDRAAALVEELFNHRTSLSPTIRERWRAFVRVLERFPMFQGKELSVDRLQANEPPVLLFEERGRSVLKLSELSSGEQQIVILTAAILIANAAIVAIEEPELSLDLKNTQLLKELLEEQIKAGLVDQIILESHVPAFDGASVIRFQRGPDGATLVTRESTVGDDALEVARKAKEQGAEQRWVTGDGYTQLPRILRNELEVGAGKHIWFLKGPERWEVWPEAELDGILGGGTGRDDG
jgi:predicted ATPase